MASVKIISLVIRTLSKPISTKIKETAQQHSRFRNVCIQVAQSLHRFETRAASANFLGSSKVQVRPLSEAKAIQQGSTFLAESFLFSVAAALILGESLRSRAQTNSRRDDVKSRLEDLDARIEQIVERPMAAPLDSHAVRPGPQHRLPPPLPRTPRALQDDVLVLRAELALAQLEDPLSAVRTEGQA